jgi:hypothetical protein
MDSLNKKINSFPLNPVTSNKTSKTVKTNKKTSTPRSLTRTKSQSRILLSPTDSNTFKLLDKKKRPQLRRIKSENDYTYTRSLPTSLKSLKKSLKKFSPKIVSRNDSFFREEVLRDPVLGREPSGLNISVYEGQPIYFKIIRSVVMSSDGELNIDNFIKEIFNGYFRPNIEFVGFPSTIVLNDSNVIMASQIFDRKFADEYKRGEYDGVRTISDYFTKRKELGTTGITWIGAPSIIFNYENRETAKNIINSTANHMIFWLTSFASSNCVAKADVSQYKYCSRFTKLKELCNDKEKYQIHDTYSNFSKNQNKFITNFEDAVDAIKKEQIEIEDYNTIRAIESFRNSEPPPTVMYQRYNELLTYFFPWDIDGVELGLTTEDKLVQLINSTLENRNIYISKYNELLTTSEGIENYLRNHFKTIVNDYIEHNDMNNLIMKGYSIPEIIFTRFLLYCKCNSMKQLNKVTESQLKNLLSYILLKLNEPLKIYEYVINLDTHTGDFVFKGLYDGTSEILRRTYKFEFFIQEKSKENDKLTNVYPFEVRFNAI